MAELRPINLESIEPAPYDNFLFDPEQVRFTAAEADALAAEITRQNQAYLTLQERRTIGESWLAGDLVGPLQFRYDKALYDLAQDILAQQQERTIENLDHVTSILPREAIADKQRRLIEAKEELEHDLRHTELYRAEMHAIIASLTDVLPPGHPDALRKLHKLAEQRLRKRGVADKSEQYAKVLGGLLITDELHELVCKEMPEPLVRRPVRVPVLEQDEAPLPLEKKDEEGVNNGKVIMTPPHFTHIDAGAALMQAPINFGKAVEFQEPVATELPFDALRESDGSSFLQEESEPLSPSESFVFHLERSGGKPWTREELAMAVYPAEYEAAITNGDEAAIRGLRARIGSLARNNAKDDEAVCKLLNQKNLVLIHATKTIPPSGPKQPPRTLMTFAVVPKEQSQGLTLETSFSAWHNGGEA